MPIKRINLLALLSIIGLFAEIKLTAQIGAHLNSICWQQITANSHTIIFPKNFEQQAFRVGNILEYMDANATRSIGEKSYPLQILLHNQTTIPNGFVGVAPYRSEFFATPPLSPNTLGTVDWLDALTIHEYRHAQQYANARVGLSKIAHYLMGDNGWGLSLSLLPNWFWEGDAVIMETALSSQGRGRSPFFSRLQRSLLLNDISYSYEKARNGSYKDLVPSQYPLGYVMTMHARQQFGHDIWKKVFSDAASYRNIIYTFSKSLQKNTGLTTQQLYTQSYEFSKNKWRREQANKVLTTPNRITPTNLKTVTHYRFPYFKKDGSLIFLKESFQKTMGLYCSKNGVEKELTTVGYTTEPYLSVTNSKVAWAEFERNPRRFEQNYSTIITYDLDTQKKTRLTKKSRLFTPSYSHDETRIVAVQITPKQNNQLVLLDGSTGIILDSIANPRNHFLTFPKWMASDEGVVFVAKTNSQLAIFKYLIESKSFQQLSNWTHHVISDLFVQQDRIYFTASFNGIDNIYSILTNRPISSTNDPYFSPTLLQHSNVAIGAYYPSVHPIHQTIVFSEYDHQGYYLSSSVIKTLQNKQWTTKSLLEPAEQKQYLINQISQEGGNVLDRISQKRYEVLPYKGFFKGLQLHSWNLTPSVAAPALDIQMDNLLNDVSINVLGGYNINEKNPFYVASLTYGKWYPQIRIFAGSSKRNAVFQSPADSLARQEFDQHTIGSTVSIPLTWNKGNFRTFVQPYASYSHRFLRNPVFEEQEIAPYTIGTYALGIDFSTLRRKAYQQVDTRFGQAINLFYTQRLQEQDRLIELKGRLYLPGLGQNHSIKMEVQYRKQSLSNSYQFSDRFEYPRGYFKPANNQFTKLAFNYHLPIAYPDWGFRGITYFKRVRANLFFDYGKSQNPFLEANNFHSLGLEILLDNHFFMELPVTLGWRNIYLLNGEKGYKYEWFISSEFF